MINVVLYQPEIPQNTGNIIRTCAATNATLHLIKPLGFSLDIKAVKRSSVKHLEDIEMKVYDDWNDFKTKNNGKFYYITRYGQNTYSNFDYSNSEENIYFIFGSESSGMPKELLRDSLDTCLRIPMSKAVRSLNISNCVTMVVYEALRQQNFNDLCVKEPHKGEDFIVIDQVHKHS